MNRCALVLIALLLAPGCSTRVGDFTLISTKNVEISRVDLKKVPFKRNVVGGDGQLSIRSSRSEVRPT